MPEPLTARYTELALKQARHFDPERASISEENWPLIERMFRRFAAYRDTLIEADFLLTQRREGLE